MSTDRLSTGYMPDFDLDLAVGRQGELFVTNIAAMLSAGTGQVEVKTDKRIANTGNVYIEHECYQRGQWRPSGIQTTKAIIWIFVLPAEVLVAAPVDSVRDLWRRYEHTRTRECTRGSHPTKGVAIPIGYFVQQLYQYEVMSA